MWADGPSEDCIPGDPWQEKTFHGPVHIYVGDQVQGQHSGRRPPLAAPWKLLPMPMSSLLTEPGSHETDILA